MPLKVPINGVVSMGRRNTKLEVYLQESQKLKSFASVESNEMRCEHNTNNKDESDSCVNNVFQ